MDLFGIGAFFSDAIGGVISGVWTTLQFLFSGVQIVLAWALAAVRFIYAAIKIIASTMSRAWSALSTIKQSGLWQSIQTLVNWIKARVKWIQTYIIKPIQLEQQQLEAIWNKFFLPIVKLFNELERLTGIVGLFDKSLAAKIDQALWSVENKLTQPILLAMQRLNLMSSYVRGLLTLGGYLDRVTMLSSVWRDAGLIRQTLSNPWGHSTTPGAVPPAPPIATVAAPFAEYVRTGAGELAPDVDQNISDLQGYLLELSAD